MPPIILVWLRDVADDNTLAMSMVHKLSKIRHNDLEKDDNWKLLFRKPPQSVSRRLNDWFNEFVDDNSDLYESTDSGPDDSSRGVLGAVATAAAAAPGVAGNVAGNLGTAAASFFLRLFASDDPKPRSPEYEHGTSPSYNADSDESCVV